MGILGVFLSAVVLLIPVYTQDLAETGASFGRVLVSSLHQAIQMFTLDADREIIMKLPVEEKCISRIAYLILSAELLIAPLLTFVLLISFFEDLFGLFRYRTGFRRDAYVFSELNEQSLALARSIRKDDRRALLVFTDVFRKEEEDTFELIEEAKAMNAILQKKDIRLIRYGRKRGRRKLYFFAIGNDETENLVQALRLIDDYRNRKNTWLYVFSSLIECELLLNTKDTGEMTVRRVDAVQSLIYRHLYEEGYAIFQWARKADPAARPVPYERALSKTLADGNEKPDPPITAHCLVLGMGRHGTEMVKALSWFGQMPGYRMVIDAYDLDEHAEERFAARCPELMSEAHNRLDLPNDAAYLIRIHGGTDVTLPSFEESVRRMDDVCCVFVALGSDTANIRTSVALRTLFAGIRGERSEVPLIESVVYQNDESRALNPAAEGDSKPRGIANYEGTPYNVRFIGSMDEMYSRDTILNSASEEEAREYHTHWAGTLTEKKESEKKLYKYGYYFRSSYSAVIHVHTLVKVLAEQGETANTVGARKTELNTVEHSRWNAYMRSEGYRHGEAGNRLGKMHRDLVPFDRLSREEQKKDDYTDSIIALMSGAEKGQEEDRQDADGSRSGKGGRAAWKARRNGRP